MLHDVFGQPFERIAEVLDRSPDAARQLASRARRRVRSAPPPSRPSPRRDREIVDAWLAAAEGGDFRRLLALLDEGAVLRADFGDRVQVIEGAARIAEQATFAQRLAAASVPVHIGGRPGVAAVIDGRVVSVMAFEIADGRIVGLDVLADAGRLERLGVGRALGLEG